MATIVVKYFLSKLLKSTLFIKILSSVIFGSIGSNCKEGIICFDHTYTLNKLALGGLRLYDFIEFYFPKYFSWVLLKQCGKVENLKEWAHQDNGTIQYFQEILRISDIDKICDFLECYLKVSKPCRNEKCYCGSGIKLKNCHLDAINILRATSKKELQHDYQKIKKVK